MGRSARPGGRYVIPVDSNGVPVAEGQLGRCTLTPGTYYYILGGADALVHSFHLTGYTSAATITSGTPQDCNHGELEVSDVDTTTGEWMVEDPSTAFVACDGTGWSHTNGVIAVTGAGVGGAMWHFSNDGAFRHRIRIVVGVTGDFRGSAWGKQ